VFQICEVVAGNAQLPTVDSQHSAQKKVSSATELLCHQNTNEQWTLSSSNSSAVVYGLGHHSSRSRGKCIVSSVSRDIASLLLISPEIGYFSCAQNEQRLLHTVWLLAEVYYSFTVQFLKQITCPLLHDLREVNKNMKLPGKNTDITSILC